MSRIIAGIYEINEQIGAGGGGIVYIGRHIRLDKKVVLKADRRSLKTDQKTLRREVDLLKELTQTYIPKVYDFVEEDGVVYTVMDYIDGESLDKLIKRKEKPSQPQMIKWACQLLEALDYLHSQPPHGILHADIKPANIMLRSNGDVCLIDYNIALALGEDGAVKVGYSKGYASPEHYRSATIVPEGPTKEYNAVLSGKKVSVDTGDKTEVETAVDDKTEIGTAFDDKTELATAVDDKTEVAPGDDKTEMKTVATEKKTTDSGSYAGFKLPEEKSGSLNIYSTGGTRMVMLDARSDIYSLGATLYHLITGVRPAEQAENVVPLSTEFCSPAVAAIINKAMQRRPDDRYQSAAEMLTAFRELAKNDPRTIRRKRAMIASGVVAGTIFLAGGGLTFVGLKQLEQRQNALALSEYSSQALAKGDVKEAISLAKQALPDGSIFSAEVTSNARNALTAALGVYELEDAFKYKEVITLPAEPFHITRSPSGRFICCTYAYEAAVYELSDLDTPVCKLPLQESALSDVVFIDDDKLIYAGAEGVSLYSISAGTNIWTKDIATNLSLSADGTSVAAVNRDADKAVVYDTSSGDIKFERELGGHLKVAANDIFADPEDDLFALSDDGSLLAVSLSNGSLTVLDLAKPDNDIIIYDESDYSHFDGGFIGDTFAFTATGGGDSQMMAVDTKEAAAIISYDTPKNLTVTTTDNGMYLAENGLLVFMDADNKYEQTELAYNTDGAITSFDASGDYAILTIDDGSFCIYNKSATQVLKDTLDASSDFSVITDRYAVVGSRDNPQVRVLELEDHSDADICSYDAHYVHDEARISADGMTATLFDINGFKVFDKNGKCLADVELPDPDRIYDQQFRRESSDSWLEVIWYDGTVREYSSADGTLLSEKKTDPPSKDLEEEFLTSKYRIVSTLHEAATVYDLDTGKEITSLKSEDYLTYVTETSEGLITQYVTSEGKKYGQLLDDNLEQIAYMPDLCDVYNNILIFDTSAGKLRQSRLFSLQELTELGE